MKEIHFYMLSDKILNMQKTIQMRLWFTGLENNKYCGGAQVYEPPYDIHQLLIMLYVNRQ